MARKEKNFHEMSKQEKKEFLRKKNRYHQHLYQMMRLRRAEAVRAKEMAQIGKPKGGEKKAGKDWGDKVSLVRNRLTGKKRQSKERWNRFCGTGDAGGRGL